MPKVSMTVNGKPVSADVDSRTLLVQFLRETLRLTGTHVGCDTSQCGCCVVHVDGVAMKSCTMLAVQAEGKAITTIEGLKSPDGTLHAVQQAWIAAQVPQCGYCQSGQIMAATALINAVGRPSEAQIDAAMTNLCRCGTYPRIRKAILAATGQAASEASEGAA